MSEHTLSQLTTLLEQAQARYRLIEHPSAGKSEEVAQIRGTTLGQGAKALVCKLKGNGISKRFLPFCRRINRRIWRKSPPISARKKPRLPALTKSPR